jgi:hypothetical protein
VIAVTHYDPDRMSVDDLDLSDRGTVEEWLNHPNTVALYDDLGQWFRSQPAEAQRPELLDHLARYKSLLSDVNRLLERDNTALLQRSFEELREALDGHIRRAEERLRELEEDGNRD